MNRTVIFSLFCIMSGNLFSQPVELKTDRLILRSWDLEKDFAVAQKLHQDFVILKTFLKPLSDDQVRAFMEAENITLAQKGYGRFVCALRETGEVIGFVGLHHTDRWIPTLPWLAMSARILPEYQQHGFATEASGEVVRDAFERLKISEIGFYAAQANDASLRSLVHAEQLGGAQKSSHLLVTWSGNVLYRLSRADCFAKTGRCLTPPARGLSIMEGCILHGMGPFPLS